MTQWWLWLYVVAMVATALWFVRWSRDPRGIPQSSYWLVVAIVLWSGAWHLVMALGGGQTEIDGRPVDWARYADWFLTAPLLVLALARTATHGVEDKRWGLMLAMVVASLAMILFGLVGDLTTGEAARFTFYSVGMLALGVLFGLIWGPLRATGMAQPPPMASLFVKVALLLSLLWFGFPLVWIVGPSGVEMIDEHLTLDLFLVLSFLMKTGWSLVDVGRLRALAEHGDLAIA